MRIRNALSVGIGAATIALVLGSCSSDTGTIPSPDENGALETTSITYGVFSTGLAAREVLVAEDLGYFDDVGLDIEFSNVATTQALIPLFASGQIDMGYLSYQPANAAMAAGVDLKLVDAVQTLNDGMQALFVRMDSNIESIEDVKDKKVGLLSVGGYGDILLGEALAEAGLTLDDVELVEVPFSNMVSSLEQEVIDVGWLPSVFIPIALNDQDERSRLLLDYNSVSSLASLPQGGTVATTTFIEENPNTLAAYAEAVQRAADYLEANPDYDLAFHAETLDVPEAALVGTALVPYEGSVNVDELQRVVDLQKKYDQLSGDIDLEAFASYQH